MVFIVIVTYEDDVILKRVYKLRHIAQYFRRVKEANPLVKHIKPLPITPWLIAMAFAESKLDTRSIPIKCIEIQERVIL